MSPSAEVSRDRAVVADDGTRLHTRVDGRGDAPALLLCNSLGTDLSLWAPQVPTWSASRRVVRFDQRGHGASGIAAGPYTLERLGRDALTVLDAYAIERADVCGISQGGQVALWLAANAPDRVRRVVAADTAARVGTEAAWRDRAASVRSGGMAAVRELVLERFFSPAFRASGAAQLDHVGELLLAMDPEGYARSCEALAVADLHPDLSRVRAPVLIVVGGDDRATPPDQAAALQAALRDARLVELPDAGHLANLERPQRFAEVVAHHLDGRTPGDGGADQ